MKIGLAQLNSRDDKERNLVAAEAAIDKLAAQGADLVMLPEMVNFLGSDLDNARAAETIPGPSTDRLQAKAREHGVFLHCGSVVESRGGRLYNTSVVFDGSGAEVARYSKIHLFDVELPDGKVYKESAAITPGGEVATFECEGLTAGLAICYDLRFPELFRALADRGCAPIAGHCRLHPHHRQGPMGAAAPGPRHRERLLRRGLRTVGDVPA